jgi:hypothetical protein
MTSATDRLLNERLQCAITKRHLREGLEEVRVETAERVRETNARLEQSERTLVRTSLMIRREAPPLTAK